MTASKARSKPAARSKVKAKAFFGKDSYALMVSGLRDQGIEREDAIETLKLGLREANALPIPLELRAAQVAH